MNNDGFLKGRPKSLTAYQYSGRIRAGKPRQGFVLSVDYYKFYESGYLREGYGLEGNASLVWKVEYKDNEKKYSNPIEPVESDTFDDMSNRIKHVQVYPIGSRDCYFYLREIEYY